MACVMNPGSLSASHGLCDEPRVIIRQSLPVSGECRPLSACHGLCVLNLGHFQADHKPEKVMLVMFCDNALITNNKKLIIY